MLASAFALTIAQTAAASVTPPDPSSIPLTCPLDAPYDPSNPFARILRGELPASRVFEDDRVLVIMPLEWNNPGHALVIPKRAVRHFDDMTLEEMGYALDIARRVGVAKNVLSARTATRSNRTTAGRSTSAMFISTSIPTHRASHRARCPAPRSTRWRSACAPRCRIADVGPAQLSRIKWRRPHGIARFPRVRTMPVMREAAHPEQETGAEDRRAWRDGSTSTTNP